jgi:RNA polymerase sigma factor (TIGR02999 family)
MRRILVEYARQRRRTKHGGEFHRVPFDGLELTVAEPPDDLLEIDAALTKLASVHPERAKLIQLRFFAGLTVQDAAKVLGISTTTAERYWTYARAWMLRELGNMEPPSHQTAKFF